MSSPRTFRVRVFGTVAAAAVCPVVLAACQPIGPLPTTPADASPPEVTASSSPDVTATSPAPPSPTDTVPSASSGGPSQPVSDDTCDVVAFEAETLAVSGGWSVRQDTAASGGAYITWEGLGREQNNSRPADVLETTVTITRPGTYRFTWAMRQPDGVASDRGNDSWLNVPEAARFGPVNGGSYPGFVKVYGNSKGRFAYSATADVNHNRTPIAIEFARAGDYVVQIAGRSHGHQIDRVVLHHESVPRDEAVAAGACEKSGTPAPAAPTTATPASPASPANGAPSGTPLGGDALLDPAADLLSLHYDHAPDKDDGHATVAGREVTTDLGIDPHVVSGAYGENRRQYNPGAEAVMAATWGSGWVDAHGDWPGAVTATADVWQATLAAGGDVWVAEGGQSDFTADVVRELLRREAGLDPKRVHVVQHSDWNERMTTDADLQYVKDRTDYIRIEDGNDPNATADLDVTRGMTAFVRDARAGDFGAAWTAACDYYDCGRILDFSDTVELLHIVGVGTDEVATVDDFADRFIR